MARGVKYTVSRKRGRGKAKRTSLTHEKSALRGHSYASATTAAYAIKQRKHAVYNYTPALDTSVKPPKLVTGKFKYRTGKGGGYTSKSRGQW